MLAARVQIQLFKWHLHCILSLQRLTWKKETERGTLKWRTKLHQFSYNEIVSSRALLPPPKSLFKPSIMQFPANLTASERCDFHLKLETETMSFFCEIKQKTQYFKDNAPIVRFPMDWHGNTTKQFQSLYRLHSVSKNYKNKISLLFSYWWKHLWHGDTSVFQMRNICIGLMNYRITCKSTCTKIALYYRAG